MKKVKKAIIAGLTGSVALVAGTVILLSNQTNDSVDAKMGDSYSQTATKKVQDVPKEDIEKVEEKDNVKVVDSKKTTEVEKVDKATMPNVKDNNQKVQSVANSSSGKSTSTVTKQEKQPVQSPKKETISSSSYKKDSSVSSQGTVEKKPVSKPNVTTNEQPKKQVSQPTAEPKKEATPQQETVKVEQPSNSTSDDMGEAELLEAIEKMRPKDNNVEVIEIGDNKKEDDSILFDEGN